MPFTDLQKFGRMYLLPGAAHSSQDRAYTVSGQNDSVPLPKLPGNANQTPTREQDQFFTALVDWVEKDVAPGENHADIARQPRQLPSVRLSAADDVERERACDAGGQLHLSLAAGTKRLRTG